MSRENLELALRACRAAAAGPNADFETMNELFDPDHVFVSINVTKLGEGVAVGGAGYRDWLQNINETLSWEADVDGGVDVSPDQVLVACTNRMHGVASGADLEQRFWMLMTVADGRITRTEAYTDPSEALEAVLAKGSD